MSVGLGPHFHLFRPPTDPGRRWWRWVRAQHTHRENSFLATEDQQDSHTPSVRNSISEQPSERRKKKGAVLRLVDLCVILLFWTHFRELLYACPPWQETERPCGICQCVGVPQLDKPNEIILLAKSAFREITHTHPSLWARKLSSLEISMVSAAVKHETKCALPVLEPITLI